PPLLRYRQTLGNAARARWLRARMDVLRRDAALRRVSAGRRAAVLHARRWARGSRGDVGRQPPPPRAPDPSSPTLTNGLDVRTCALKRSLSADATSTSGLAW